MPGCVRCVALKQAVRWGGGCRSASHSLLLIGLLGLALAAAAPARATSVLFGDPPDEFNATCFPFGCTDLFPSNRYQQAYDASGFSGTLGIVEIRFFQTQFPGGALNDGVYEIRLSTTSKGVNALDTDFVSNIGPDETLFATVADLDSVFDGTTLVFASVTPFVFDPTEGNLLVDIQISGVSENGTDAFFDSRIGTSAGAFGQMHNFDGVFADTGLTTQFLVPEPVSGSLLASGLLGLTWLSRRRQHA